MVLLRIHGRKFGKKKAGTYKITYYSFKVLSYINTKNRLHNAMQYINRA